MRNDSRRGLRTALLVTVGGLAAAGSAFSPLHSAAQSAAGAAPVQTEVDPLEAVLAVDQVGRAVAAAALSSGGEGMSVCVVDRAGRTLALWRRPFATAAGDERALSLARTGAFFANNQAPLSSRTVRFISGIHFPPDAKNTPSAPLYGIENTNRVSRKVTYNSGQEFPEPLNLAGTGPSLGISTGKRDLRDSEPRAVDPGGFPIYRNGQVVGGIGVAGVPALSREYSAFVATVAFRDFKNPFNPGKDVIFADGIVLPFVSKEVLNGALTGKRPRGVAKGEFPGTGNFVINPKSGGLTPSGYVVGPTASFDLPQEDVERIVEQSRRSASATRALIRLPLGSRTRMVIAVGDLDGNILAVYRMKDSTIFSVDVAIAKARNVVYFSGPNRPPSDLPGLPVGTAVTNRSISFGAQPLFPSGIDDSRPGPFFELFKFDTFNPGTQGSDNSINPKNGIVFFPGSMPLYRDGRLIGGLGISGDGVEQDDFVAHNGAKGFLPPRGIRSDNHQIRGVRIPFLKFPRNPLD